MAPWDARDLPRDQKPDPRELGGSGGVTLWDNAYRSGDYVGRNLWRTDQHCTYVWTPDAIGSPVAAPLQSNSTEQAPPPQPPDPPVPENVRLEFCICPRPHPHYWADTPPLTAKELDPLI